MLKCQRQRLFLRFRVCPSGNHIAQHARPPKSLFSVETLSSIYPEEFSLYIVCCCNKNQITFRDQMKCQCRHFNFSFPEYYCCNRSSNKDVSCQASVGTCFSPYNTEVITVRNNMIVIGIDVMITLVNRTFESEMVL